MVELKKKKSKPRGADPSKTRAKILKAARKLFVAGGINGASMRAIAQKAQVTQSLLHHHFGSKENLWQKVKAELLGEYLSNIEQQIESENDTGKKGSYADVLENRFRFMQNNPDIVRMALWQRLDNFRTNSTSKGHDLLTHLIEGLNGDQKCGEIRKDISPGMMTAVIFILTSGWFMQDYQWVLDLDKDNTFASRDDANEAYLEAIKKIFLEGVLP